MSSHHEHLARLMDHRRLELGMKWDEVAAAAGVKPPTLRAIRAGTNAPSPLTRRGLERALQWPSGAVERILAGGTPTPTGSREETVEQIADQVDSDLAAMGEQIRQAIERRRGRALTENQRRVVIEWSDALERTIDVMDEDVG